MNRPHIKIENGAWFCKGDGWKVSVGASTPAMAYAMNRMLHGEPFVLPAGFFGEELKPSGEEEKPQNQPDE